MNPAVVHVASGREWRGGQRQVWLLARELQRRNIDQVVVTGGDSELARRLAQDHIALRPVSWRAGLDPRVIPRLLLELRPRPAVLHAHDAHALTLAGIAGLLSNAPVIATRRVSFPLRRAGFWRRARHVIAISQSVADTLRAAGIPSDRITLIPDAVDLSELAGARSGRVGSLLGLPAFEQLAVSLGALTPEKDHATLLEAAARLVQDLPGLHWVIVGEGPLRRPIEERIARLGLGDRVHLVGDLPDPHVALERADIYVLSSVAEGLGSSVLAAMASGVPVVATRAGGIPELLGTNRGVLVSPSNPAELAAAVRKVLSDKPLRQQLVREALKEAAKFDARAMAERVLGVYRSVFPTLRPS